jgi:uncharacterized Fe-S cluster-containing radical SAM superfamily protein
MFDSLPFDLLFIAETNGILMGHDRTYAQDLSRYANLYVRVSIKGTHEAEFSRLTGADAEGFGLQLKALENLCRANIKVHPAVMGSFSTFENIQGLRRQISQIDRGFEAMEIEEVELYGDVEKRLQQAGIAYRSAGHSEKQ